MFTHNRRNTQNSNLSPMGRNWYPLGGGLSLSTTPSSSGRTSFQNTSRNDINSFNDIDLFFQSIQKK